VHCIMSQQKYPFVHAHHPNGANSHGQHGYHSVRPSSTVPTPLGPFYGDSSSIEPPRAIQSAYPSTYYTNSNNYPSTSPSTNSHGYSPISQTTPMNYAQARPPGHFIHRPQTTMPHTVYSRAIPRPQYSHSSSHSYSNSFSQSSTLPSHSMYPVSERRSVSPPPTSHTASPFTDNGSPSDLPSSSVRPFACDLCSLSFNRQHDLKRHRETHTGEKPFLCNGGCGKTFTRKDALKRHQLVKSCGNIDDWA